MKTRRQKGILGEAKALLHFVSEGYEVYLPYADCASYDMLVVKNGISKRVSIKYVSYSVGPSWLVSLTNVSRRNHGKVAVKKFDSTSVDLLAVYIEPEDRVILFDSKQIDVQTLSIRKLDR